MRLFDGVIYGVDKGGFENLIGFGYIFMDVLFIDCILIGVCVVYYIIKL